MEAAAGTEGRAMRLLLLDTCGVDGSIALAEGGSEGAVPVVVAMARLPGRSSSERLFPELRAMLEGRGWRMEELAAVGVASGPGSFTGVRVGVTAAKGWCEGTGVPLVMVSRLAVLAGKAGGTRCALLDAGRGEFFRGRFEEGVAPVEALLGREAVLREVLAGEERVAVCEEVVRVAFAELEPVVMEPLEAGDLLGSVVARLGRREFDDVATADANYVRRTDLEMLVRLGRRLEGA